DRVLDGQHLLDPGTHRGVRRRPVRNTIEEVRRDSDRLSRNHDDARTDRVGVDPDAVEALTDGEGHDLPMVLEGAPATAGAQLQSDAAIDERLVVRALELVVGIDAATHA